MIEEIIKNRDVVISSPPYNLIEFCGPEFIDFVDVANYVSDNYIKNIESLDIIYPDDEGKLIHRIKNTIKLLGKCFLNLPIDDKLSMFVNSYILLLYNWNNLVYQDDDIKQDIVLIERYFKLHLTSIELVTNILVLIERMKHIENHHSQIFEISKYYLKFLDEDDKKDEKKEDCIS